MIEAWSSQSDDNMDEIICCRCKCKAPKTGKNQKYCQSCSYIVHLEQMKKRQSRKRQKEDGAFGAHPIKNKRGHINFKAEHMAIKKEMIRLGLRK